MARRRKVPPFSKHEVVRVVSTPETEHWDVVGLTGTVVYGGRNTLTGEWYFEVILPKRRRTRWNFDADELESTGEFATPEPPEFSGSLTVRVDPGTGDTTVLDEAGNVIEDEADDAAEHGLELFRDVRVTDPAYPTESGIVVGKARLADGSWRYAVLLQQERRVRAFDASWVRAFLPTSPGDFLDYRRPRGIDELERSETVPYLAAWDAPAPLFGYDQYVRVLDRPHTAPVAGRTGRVVLEYLRDDFSWSYYVVLDDDPGSPYESVTAAEEDLEATGGYGDAYNPPPDWLRPRS